VLLKDKVVVVTGVRAGLGASIEATGGAWVEHRLGG
jgi:hypothetical protein